jgi:hypothetical protein
MLRAMVYKELRETVVIGALALVAFALVNYSPVSFFTNYGDRGIPFVRDSFVSAFVMVAVGFAIVLGLRQSFVESMRGTWLFLLHRPLPRWQVIAVKLAVGGALYLVCAAVPILIYAQWAATPGTHASPFEWSMTATTWQFTIAALNVYLAAFLVGIRQGRWFGTRLWPLAAAGLLTALVMAVPWWWSLGLALSAAIGAWLIAVILFTAYQRDY